MPLQNVTFFLSELSLLRRQQLTRSYSEKQRYDGWYNNLAHPHWGSVGKRNNFFYGNHKGHLAGDKRVWHNQAAFDTGLPKKYTKNDNNEMIPCQDKSVSFTINLA